VDDILQCYKVLELTPGVPPETVRRSYIELTHVWDPHRYLNNPILRAQAEQKRKEIDDAYMAIRAFLPELQSPFEVKEKEQRAERDFTELTTGAPMESSRAILGILVGIVFLLIFAWALYVLMKGRTVTSLAPSLE
jgi:hypothetical protein